MTEEELLTSELIQSATTNTSSSNLRRALLRALGFVRDLFGSGVAEMEYYEAAEEAKVARQKRMMNNSDSAWTTRSPTPTPHHLSFSPDKYFVNPFENEAADDLLRRKGNVAIVGEVGSGKTTLRLHVEGQIRLAAKDRLTVAYLPGRERGTLSDIDDHLQLMARALTTDLLIQIVERNDFRYQPATDSQNEALLDLLQFDAVRYRETLYHLAQGRVTSIHWGMAELWQDLSRHVVKGVSPSPELCTWAGDLAIDLKRRGYRPPVISGREHWQLALEATRLWGFSGVIVMVDSIDANSERNSVADMEALLKPLLDRLTEFKAEGVELKFFLPAELKDVLDGLKDHFIDMRELKWNDEGLRLVIFKRMKHSGRRWGALGDLAEPEFMHEIDELVIQQAKGSPRRLIKLVSEMIGQRAEKVRHGPANEEPASSTRMEALFTRPIFNNSISVLTA